MIDLPALVRAIRDDPSLAADLAAALAPYLDDRSGAELLTTTEAAELLRCDPARVRRLVHERRLRGTKDGARLLVRRRDLDAHLQVIPTRDDQRRGAA